MFFAHLPAGYLIGRFMQRKSRPDPGVGMPAPNTWGVTAAMIGAVFPDLDLVYLNLFETTPLNHHTYWTHLPFAWLLFAIFSSIAARHRSPAFRLALRAFLLGGFSHLVLDSLAGDIWWLYPFRDQPFSLTHVKASYEPWWLNFVLHWTMLAEIAIIATALWVEHKWPILPSRIRPGIYSSLALTLVFALILKETYLPEPQLDMPVLNASRHDWNPASYWHTHWGNSGVHKGIDIFGERGTPVLSAESGLVVYKGQLENGGKVLLVLSPNGWLHYYAHLDSFLAPVGSWAERHETIGTVGNTGNAAGKPPHLHYAIFSFIPRMQDFRPVEQGWKRVFYRNPGLLIQRT